MEKPKKSAGLKSAFDLAMERLEKAQGPLRRLTEEQREELAHIERNAKAKIAEIEIMFDGQIASARAAGDEEKVAELEERKRLEIRKVRERAEEEKDRVHGRTSSSSAGESGPR